MPNSRSFTYGIAVLVALTNAGFAQDSDSVTSEPSSLVRATRIMRRIDKDGNGTFEKSESAAVWRRYRKLDANRDGVISIDELRKEKPASLETAGERKLNVVYKTVAKQKLRLDLYYPRDAGKQASFPVVLYTHGGGWAAGSKQGIARGSFKSVFSQLLDHGFAVASVDYRLAKKGSGVTMRDCVVDCKDAARYLSKHGAAHKLSSDRFFVMGDSAGGHIAQMLLLSSPKSLTGEKELASTSYKMLAGVSWYGPCDFEKESLFNHDDRAKFRDRFGPRILGSKSDPAEKLKRYREVSPVNYLTKVSPPLLMIQGDKDTTIPVKHAHYMKQKATAVAAPVEFMIIRNAGHNWRKVGAEIEPSRDVIIERTVRFFVDHLQRSAATASTASTEDVPEPQQDESSPNCEQDPEESPQVQTEPKSTVGLVPPKGAEVLFDGSNFAAWKPFSWQWINPKDDQKEIQWKLTDDKAMQITFEFNGKPRKQFLATRKNYGSYRLHLEFMLPEKDSGNSGLFFGPLYELQIINSAGKKKPGMNDCGAIYQIRVPDKNVAKGPGVWQTFDVDFKAARFDANGFMTEKNAARVTVRHNGVLIHNNFKLSLRRNRYAAFPEKPLSPIVLQSHGSPVKFRNIWLLENAPSQKRTGK